MKQLLELFLTFAKIGGFTFGGGIAMLPMLQKEIVEKKNWATQEELMDYYAIGQCTPGIIAINTATFVGYKQKGIIGGIVATFGMAFPSVVIITIIAALVSNFQDLQVVQWAFGGIRAAVVALILSSVIKLMKKSVIDIPTALMFIAVAVLSTVTSVSPIVFVLIAGAFGILLKGGKKS
ncbi:MAG: chromate transporter [Acutalibacteraceae bacterium]